MTRRGSRDHNETRAPSRVPDEVRPQDAVAHGAPDTAKGEGTPEPMRLKACAPDPRGTQVWQPVHDLLADHPRRLDPVCRRARVGAARDERDGSSKQNE